MFISLTFIIFLIFIFSITIIIASTPVYSVLSLIASVICVSFFLFFLGFEFLPYLILMIYIGAVAVLFLFVTMMLNMNLYFKAQRFSSNNLIYLVIFIKSLTFFYCFIYNSDHLSIYSHSNIWIMNFINYNQSDILLFANSLYYYFSVYTILISLLLFIGMVGSISLCLSNKNLY